MDDARDLSPRCDSVCVWLPILVPMPAASARRRIIAYVRLRQRRGAELPGAACNRAKERALRIAGDTGTVARNRVMATIPITTGDLVPGPLTAVEAQEATRLRVVLLEPTM